MESCIVSNTYYPTLTYIRHQKTRHCSTRHCLYYAFVLTIHHVMLSMLIIWNVMYCVVKDRKELTCKYQWREKGVKGQWECRDRWPGWMVGFHRHKTVVSCSSHHLRREGLMVLMGLMVLEKGHVVAIHSLHLGVLMGLGCNFHHFHVMGFHDEKVVNLHSLLLSHEMEDYMILQQVKTASINVGKCFIIFMNNKMQCSKNFIFCSSFRNVLIE